MLVSEEEYHLENVCPNRNVSCPNNCGRKPVLSQMKDHLERVCKYRVVECSLGCGTQGIRAEDLEDHMEYDCPNRPGLAPAECRFGCGIKGLVQETLDEHEVEAECCYGCGEEGLGLCTLKLHQESCGFCPVKCDLCSEELQKQFMKEHKAKHCPERNVRCSQCKASAQCVLLG